jgi:hypothetical protein
MLGEALEVLDPSRVSASFHLVESTSRGRATFYSGKMDGKSRELIVELLNTSRKVGRKVVAGAEKECE